jgi:hypothetical protein
VTLAGLVSPSTICMEKGTEKQEAVTWIRSRVLVRAEGGQGELAT